MEILTVTQEDLQMPRLSTARKPSIYRNHQMKIKPTLEGIPNSITLYRNAFSRIPGSLQSQTKTIQSKCLKTRSSSGRSMHIHIMPATISLVFQKKSWKGQVFLFRLKLKVNSNSHLRKRMMVKTNRQLRAFKKISFLKLIIKTYKLIRNLQNTRKLYNQTINKLT